MSANSQHYIVKEALINGGINAVVNGAFAWYLSAGKPELAVWGQSGVLVDFLATAAILVFILSLIVLPLQRRKLAKMPLASAEPPFGFLRYLGWLAPQHDALKALILAWLAALLSLPVLWLGFALFGVDTMGRWDYTLLKSLYTGVVAASVVVVIVLLAMHPVRRVSHS
ncbi:hypothetical protein [Spongiibacter sp.]|uniref:hypothetical protein n=1 Tax=Spongiibacter sp. TaxID=2024860 RepID=UPI003565F66D